jgi:SAM-dependent methyltransferase
MSIAYCDGAEQEVLEILCRADDLSSTSLNAHERYGDWPIRYHLCPERSNLLRHLDFAGLDVLELGAGMGGASRYIAENARRFVAVEGSEARAAALRRRLHDLNNWESFVANLQDYQTDERFDVVCLIGVLEYAELYIDPPAGMSPFEWTMRHAASFLKPGGCLIVAIENRNGIKYWAGAPEDHTGRMFDGICGYGPSKTPRTFSRKTLLDHFNRAGLPEIAEYYPWPDYKTPSSVVGRRLVERFPFLASDIAADATAHDRLQMTTYFPWTLALREVARSGLLAELANSFLFVASASGPTTIKEALLGDSHKAGECAWHYSIHRNEPIRTSFRLGDDAGAEPTVHKHRIPGACDRAPGSMYSEVVWSPSQGQQALLHQTVLMTLRRHAFADDGEGFVGEFERFIRWAVAGNALDDDHLASPAFDLTPSNAVSVEGAYAAFDLEWHLKGPLRKSWFVLRNVFVVRDASHLFGTPPEGSFADLYHRLCLRCDIVPDLQGDIEREAKVQADIQRAITFEFAQEVLENTFKEIWRPAPFPKDPRMEIQLRGLGDQKRSFVARLARLIVSPRAMAAAVARRCGRVIRMGSR